MSSQFSSFPRHFCFVKISKNPFIKKKSEKNAKIRSFISFFSLFVISLRYVCVFCVMRLFAVYENIFHETSESAFVHSSVLMLFTTCCSIKNNLIIAWNTSVSRMTIYYSVLFLFSSVFFFWFSEEVDFLLRLLYMAQIETHER